MVAQLSPAPVNSSARPLLERIIQASSNEGDVVLDPFCGCGRGIAAAQKLGRTSFGMVPTGGNATVRERAHTLSTPAVSEGTLVNTRVSARYSYRVIGQPEDLDGVDPFCGCGTTIPAAQKLNREWIGIAVTHLAVGLMKLRLKDSFRMVPVSMRVSSPSVSSPHVSKGNAEHTQASDTHSDGDEALTHVRATDTAAAAPTYRVIGQPEDLDRAKELALNDRYGFQWWILPLIGARALGAEKGQKEGKKGSDKGIDGIMVFTDDNSGKAKRVIVSVKSGHPNVTHIRDLGHVIDRENAAIGIFLTLEPPTKPMLTEAAEKGFYHSPGWNKDYPRLQILTVEDILDGKTVDLPPNLQTYKQAEKVIAENTDQGSLGFE